MGSSAKGTDGQVQYNDEGKTAGADVYYDKATGKLEQTSPACFIVAGDRFCVYFL